MRAPLLAAAIAGLLALASPLAGQITTAPAPKSRQAVKVDPSATGPVHPRGVAFLPDGPLRGTERPGRLRLIDNDGKLSASLQGVPQVYASRQRGLLHAQIGPEFAPSA